VIENEEKEKEREIKTTREKKREIETLY